MWPHAAAAGSREQLSAQPPHSRFQMRVPVCGVLESTVGFIFPSCLTPCGDPTLTWLEVSLLCVSRSCQLDRIGRCVTVLVSVVVQSGPIIIMAGDMAARRRTWEPRVLGLHPQA